MESCRGHERSGIQALIDSQDRSAERQIRRGEQSPAESHLLRAKTDCVEGDFVLPIEIRRDLGVSAALLKLI